MMQAGDKAWRIIGDKAYSLLVVVSNRDRVASIKVNPLKKSVLLVEVICRVCVSY
jgi:hypothetical protein